MFSFCRSTHPYRRPPRALRRISSTASSASNYQRLLDQEEIAEMMRREGKRFNRYSIYLTRCKFLLSYVNKNIRSPVSLYFKIYFQRLQCGWLWIWIRLSIDILAGLSPFDSNKRGDNLVARTSVFKVLRFNLISYE